MLRPCTTFVLCLLMCLIRPCWAEAAEPVTTPLLRVETGMHTSLVRRVLPDLPRNRLITCSDDKTVRVWQMPEMRLVSVLRVPIDAGHEGQLSAVAVSPDGETVATAGWTGWDWEGHASIYFFDVATGELIHRISGFDNVVNALAWLDDGEHLAVGLQGYSGFRVLNLREGSTVAADTQYLDDVMDMDVSRRGRIIVTALDGFVRLYDRSFKLIGRREIPGGSRPVSVRFSPDGDAIALGFLDVPAISVISSRDLSLLYHPDTDRITDQVGFTSVVWSSDGELLFASGQYSGEGLNPVYRWRERGTASPEKMPLTQNRITEIQQMPENRIAFAAEDPGVGVMAPDGTLELFRGPDVANFSRSQEHLALSPDASVVRYPLDRDNRFKQSFNIFGGGDQDTSTVPNEPLHTAITSAEGIVVSDWLDSFNPTINGIVPQLDEYEFSRCYAMAPDGGSVLLGTEWALRLLRPDASEIWNVKLSAVVWSVNVSPDGRFALAALSDGTIRWYLMGDGREVLAYFPHNNGRDWIAWVPDGYYMSSVYGDNYVGWHLNRGKDLTPDFYRAVQFDRILYRPDVVTSSFRRAMGPTKRSLEAPPRDADFRIDELRRISPPRLRVTKAGLEDTSDGPALLTLELRGEKTELTVHDYSVYVNHIPVIPARDRRLSGGEKDRFQRTIQMYLPERHNEIRVEAFNGVSMGVAETYVGLPREVSPAPVKGNLYMLAVGVNVFPALPRRAHLSFAAQDAGGIASAWKERAAGTYGEVFVRIISDLSDDQPYRDTILSALEFVEQAGPDDTVVIFLASHGISDPAGNYYFVPRDVVPRDIASAQEGEEAGSLIPWVAFFDALRDAAGRRILIVDTCQARNIEGKFEPHSLMKRSAASQFALIVASKGDEESQEYAPARHGLFTYSLISAMHDEAALDLGKVTLRDIFEIALPIVEELRHKETGPQTPQMVAPPVLADLPVLYDGRWAGGGQGAPIR